MVDESHLGERLKQIRVERGLSQRKLATLSGVANATISQIESGAVSPTVGILKKLLDCIPISLADFFAQNAPERADVNIVRAGEFTQLVEGGVSYRQVGRDLSSRAIQLMWETYASGANTGRYPLTHDGEECGIILSGQLTVVVREQSYVLNPGDAYYFKSDQPHSFRNDGVDACEVVSACTPPTF